MLKLLRSRSELAFVLSLGLATSASAQNSDAKDAAGDAGANDLHFFVGQRIWMATWDQAFLDAQIVVPNPLAPTPVLQQSNKRAISGTTVMPLTAFGVRFKDWTFSASLMPQTGFSTEGVAAGDRVRRDEGDLSLGYSFTPNISASVVYKIANIDNAATARATQLTGISGSYKIDALMFGLSVNAPLQGPLALYGNFAIGPARETVSATGLQGQEFRGTYQISELGFAYRLTDQSKFLGLKNVSLQLGYRSQIVTMNDLDFSTYSVSPIPALLSTEKRNVQSATQGFVFGIAAIF